jgi:hypothetical protein
VKLTKKRHIFFFTLIVLAFSLKLSFTTYLITRVLPRFNTEYVVETEESSSSEKENAKELEEFIKHYYNAPSFWNATSSANALKHKSKHFEQNLNQLNPYLPIFAPPPNC